MINAMRGTRMGRIVKTEREVLEEIAQSGSWQEPVVEDLKQAISPDLGVKSSTPSIFHFEAIQIDDKGNLVLHGLEVPEGRIDRIKLQFGLLYNGNPLNAYQWYSYSRGLEVFDTAGNLYLPKPSSPPEFHICPLKAWYWFAKAAYIARVAGYFEPEVDVLVNALRQDLHPNGNYFADRFFQKITNPPNQSDQLVHDIYGWPEQTPFGSKGNRALHGAHYCETPEWSVYSCNPLDQTENQILEILFGEKIGANVFRTLAFIQGNESSVQIRRSKGPLSDVTPVSLCGGETTRIYINDDWSRLRPARGLQLKPEHFHPRQP